MSITAEISQRDLRLRSKDIMDAVERGETFAVTRDGRPMGQLIPLRRPFASRERVIEAFRSAPVLNGERLRADTDGLIDPWLDDPYER